MAIPGIYTLATQTITTALTTQIYTAIEDLDGMTEAAIQAIFTYGSGGTTAIVKVQTSFDGGELWHDIARMDFATTSAVKYANLSARLSKAVTSYADLSAEGVFDAVLGDRLRAVVTTTGTYAGSTLLVVRARVS